MLIENDIDKVSVKRVLIVGKFELNFNYPDLWKRLYLKFFN